MVRLSSKDVSLLIKVIVAKEKSRRERLKIVKGASKSVRLIAEALIDNAIPVDEDIRDATEAIRDWADETRRITQTRFEAYA